MSGPPPAVRDSPLLEIERLTVRFGPATVVDDVSFSVFPGEKFALVGESGSGMPVLASNSIARARAAFGRSASCSSSTSPIWLPTV